MLIGLERRDGAGGHVKYWERIALAAQRKPPPLALDIHYLGRRPGVERLAPDVTIEEHRPVLPTRAMPWLRGIPDHTDLAPVSPALWRRVWSSPLLHLTQAQFSFCSTARWVTRFRRRPTVVSLHTDTASYGRIYTNQLIRGWLGVLSGGARLADRLDVGRRVERNMHKQIQRQHEHDYSQHKQEQCQYMY